MQTIADVMQMPDKAKIEVVTVRLDEISEPEWNVDKNEFKQKCRVSDSTGQCDLSRVYKEGNFPFTKVGITVTLRAYQNKTYGLTGLYRSNWQGDRGGSTNGIRMTNTAKISVADGDSTPPAQRTPKRQPPDKTSADSNDGGLQRFLDSCKIVAMGAETFARELNLEIGNAEVLAESRNAAVSAFISAKDYLNPSLALAMLDEEAKEIERNEESVDDKREKFSPPQSVTDEISERGAPDEGKCTECGFHTCQCPESEPLVMDDDPSGDPPF